MHLLLGHDIFLTLSDIVILFLGDICLFDVHHVEVNFGLSCCCSDLVVFEGTLEVCRILDKFWTYDPILCGTWDMKVVFDLEEKRKRSGEGGGWGGAVRSSVTALEVGAMNCMSHVNAYQFAVGQVPSSLGPIIALLPPPSLLSFLPPSSPPPSLSPSSLPSSLLLSVSSLSSLSSSSTCLHTPFAVGQGV